MESIAERSVLQPGEMLNWYKIIRVLGRGGFGVTYLAQDTNLQMDVAIKEYLPSDIGVRDKNNTVKPCTAEDQPIFNWGLQNFLDEARTLVKFKHSNIVRVMTVFESNGTAYMIMEYERGQDLKQFLKVTRYLNEVKLKNLILPIIDGLVEVHNSDFIHRDIKPANIYIRENNSPVLLDFGSARLALGGATQQLTALVSVGYTPLEQYGESADNQQGPWTDIYSLGAVLYFSIAGKPPVESTIRASAILNNKPDPLRPIADIGRDRYSPGFLSAIDWALKFKVTDRPMSLENWRDRLFDEPTKPQRTKAIHKDPALDRSGHSRRPRESTRDSDYWEIPAQQQRVQRARQPASKRSKPLWPWLLLLIGLPLVFFGYLKLVVYPEEVSGLMQRHADSQMTNDSSTNPEQSALTAVADNSKALGENAAQQKTKNDASREAETAARIRREQESTRQAELEARAKHEQEAARQAELEARAKHEQEAARQAELEGRAKREQEAVRQAALEARAKREQEIASRDTLARAREIQEKPVAPVTPITDTELQEYAVAFDSLGRAIRSRDLEKVDEIAPLPDLYRAMLGFWFDTYNEIDIRISGISTNRNGGRVESRIVVRKLVRQDGSIVMPPQAYRSIRIYTERSGISRSKIKWHVIE